MVCLEKVNLTGVDRSSVLDTYQPAMSRYQKQSSHPPNASLISHFHLHSMTIHQLEDLSVCEFLLRLLDCRILLQNGIDQRLSSTLKHLSTNDLAHGLDQPLLQRVALGMSVRLHCSDRVSL